MPVFNNILAGAAGSAGGAAAYEIERSLRFNDDDSAYLSRTPSSAGNRKTFTFSAWVKKTSTGSTFAMLGSGTDTTNLDALDFNGEQLRYTRSTSGSFLDVKTNAVFRDPSAWYHVVLAVDTTQSTASNRVKIYVNGVQETSLAASNYPSQNEVTFINSTEPQVIGRRSAHQDNYFDGYMADAYLIDGSQLDPTSFGEFDDNGVWQPKAYSGTYGTNGFHLDFSDNSSAAALGNDAAGNNNWTVSSNIVAENALTLPGVLFDGTDDHIECADDTDLTFGSNDFTIEFFVKPKSFSGLGSLVQKYSGTASTSTIWMSTDTSGNVSFYVYYDAGSASTITSSHSLTLNKWSHVACVRDGTTLRLYIDGVQRGSSSTIGTEAAIDSSTPLRIGEDSGGNYDFNGVISNVRIVNGTCLYTNGTIFTVPTAPLTNVTNTKLLCCQSSTSVTAAAVTPNNLTTGGNPVATEESDSSGDNDSLLDSPTNYEADSGNNGGNYATWNRLLVTSQNDVSNGNLDLAHAASQGWTGNNQGSNYQMVVGNIGMTTGKWYWEITLGTMTDASLGLMGSSGGHNYYPGYSANGLTESWGWGSNGVNYNTSGLTVATSPATYVGGDTLGFAYDADNGYLYCHKNGTYQNSGNPAAGTGYQVSGYTGTQYFCAGKLGSNSQINLVLNTGQRPFAYTPPTGFKSVCTQNLDDPLIADGSEYFDIVTATGNGQASRSFPLGFSPDFIWAKSRNLAYHHDLLDSVRGTTARLMVSSTNAESSYTTALQSFDSDGFTWGNEIPITQAGTYGSSVDENGVFWCWDGGTSNTLISAGSLTSSIYNQSQTWSTYGTFDNNWSNSAYHWDDVFNTTLANNGDGSLYVDGTTKDTWNLSSSYAVSNTIKVYTQNPTEITINEGLSDETISTSSGTGFHYHSFSFTGNVASVGVRHASGGGIYFMGIWFDGKQLVDDTETVPTVPTIASNVRANPTAGFSIISYTGTGSAGTIGHGLNAQPHMVIVKNRDTAGYNWKVLHKDLTGFGTYMLSLDSDAAESPASASWFNSTAPTSSTISLGTLGAVNASNEDYICYAFAPVEGYSAFGKYTGNGSNTDGPFVYLGFRPKFFMVKNIGSGWNWNMFDSERSPSNVVNDAIRANLTDTEVVDYISANLVFTSNGVRVDSNWNNLNQSGGTFIYMALAENPFKYARAR